MNSPSQRIFFTFVLSLVVHVIIVTSWRNDEIRIPQAGGQGMTVTLVVQANKILPPETPVAEPSPKAQPKLAHVSKPEPVRKPQSPHKDKPQPVAVAVISKTNPVRQKDITPPVVENTVTSPLDTQIDRTETHDDPASQLASIESNNKRLESVLQKAFNAEFYYPRLAVRRGWQGKVQLGLRIEADGHLSDIRVMQGSGYTLLDNAALKSLNKVEVLPTAVSLLDGRSLELILPVEYRLL